MMLSGFNYKLYNVFHKLSKEFSLHYCKVTKDFCKHEQKKEAQLKEKVERHLNQ
jgi:hypothetical protein